MSSQQKSTTDSHRAFSMQFCVQVGSIWNICLLASPRPYRGQMNRLLSSLLKLDPAERMTFPEFFDFVDDLITSKVEVVNLLHGTTFKIIYDPNMT